MTTESRRVTFEEETFEAIREGAAEILNRIPAEKEEGSRENGNGKDKPDSKPQAVFYNPIQQFNRDLSVLAIRVFSEDLLATRQQHHGKRRTDGKKPKKGRDGHVGEGTKAEGEKNASKQGMVPTHAWESKAQGEASKKRKRDDAEDPEAVATEQPPSKIVKQSRQAELAETGAGGNQSAAGEVPSIATTNTQSKVSTNFSGQANGRISKVSPANENGLHSEPLQDERNDEAMIAPSGPKDSTAVSHQQVPQIRILDALSATGLRALRYAKEIPQVTSVTANDLSSSAAKAIAQNVRYNELAAKIEVRRGDALDQLHANRSHYEVIDLDPYGTATAFLDAAVQSLTNGGLLCVTCTDAGILATVAYPEKTFSQYGGVSVKGPQSHEAGLRLVLQAIATSAARYGLAVEPLLSLSIDFYVRVFVKIRRSPQEVKYLAAKTMVVYNCDYGCGAWSKQYLAQIKAFEDRRGDSKFHFASAQGPSSSPLCEHCGFKTHLAGPMWGGPIQNPYFIQRMLDLLPSLSSETYGTKPRIEGMLTTARDETLLPPSANPQPKAGELNHEDSPAESPYPLPRLPPHEPDLHPFFFLSSTLARAVHCNAPSDNALRGALIGLGYRVTRTHMKPGSLRTDAPWSVIWEVFREWVRQKCTVKEDACRPGTAGWGIMQKGRSNVQFNRAKRDLEEILKRSNEIDDLKTKLQALLWKLENPGQNAESNAQQPATEGLQAADNEQPDRATKAPETREGGLTKGRIDIEELSNLKVDFNEKLGRESYEKRQLVRYQLNPRANWGPMSRAKG